MVKKYESINNLHLITTVKVDGKDREIRFRGGRLTPRQSGTFSTDDKQLQKALESDSGYNVTFRECVEDSVSKSVEEIKVSEKVELKNILEVRTIEMAYTWFHDTLSIYPRNGLKHKKIREMANRYGYDFPNLEGKATETKLVKRV